MKLLKISDKDHEEFDEYFDETEKVELDKISPQVIEGVKDVRVRDKSISEFDAAFAEIPSKNVVFGRVLLEMIEEQGVKANHPSTAFFIMAKKNYLYHVLHDSGIPAPKTVCVATEKASRNIEREIKGPVLARKLEDLKEEERQKLDTVEEIQSFAEGSEYEDDILLFHELNKGDKYRCLVIGDQIISLEDTSEGWRFKEDGLNYSNLSDTQKEIVLNTAKTLGTEFAEVYLRGEEVFDLNPNPDLELYTDIGGKNAFKAVAKVLKEGSEG